MNTPFGENGFSYVDEQAELHNLTCMIMYMKLGVILSFWPLGHHIGRRFPDRWRAPAPAVRPELSEK